MRRLRIVTCLGVGAALALGFGGGVASSSRPETAPAKPSAGCGTAAAVAPGSQRIDTTSGGVPRFYLRSVPTSYDGKRPVPLVVDLHGRLEGAELHETNSRLGAFGAEHGFATITPQGSGDVTPDWLIELDSPDARFVMDVLDEAERTLCIDDRRIFLTGYSGGAFMTSALACAHADRIAAVAPVAALRNPARCKPSRPMPVVTFAGTSDEWVAYAGGLGRQAQAASAEDGTGRTLGETSTGKEVARSASMPKITAAWAKRNDCGAKPKESQVAPDVTRVRYRCPRKADVELYRIEGGGHTWPGSEFSRAVSAFLGPTTFSIDANAIMWEFFQNHPLRGR
jgi:polyhydroxybutyrate depolymerase